MDRRKFIQTTAAGAGALAVASCGNAEQASGDGTAPAVVRKKRELKMVTTWPKNLPGLGTAPERIAENVAEATDGALNHQSLRGRRTGWSIRFIRRRFHWRCGYVSRC